MAWCRLPWHCILGACRVIFNLTGKWCRSLALPVYQFLVWMSVSLWLERRKSGSSRLGPAQLDSIQSRFNEKHSKYWKPCTFKSPVSKRPFEPTWKREPLSENISILGTAVWKKLQIMVTNCNKWMDWNTDGCYFLVEWGGCGQYIKLFYCKNPLYWKIFPFSPSYKKGKAFTGIQPSNSKNKHEPTDTRE